jgi:hypothetical protein
VHVEVYVNVQVDVGRVAREPSNVLVHLHVLVLVLVHADVHVLVHGKSYTSTIFASL